MKYLKEIKMDSVQLAVNNYDEDGIYLIHDSSDFYNLVFVLKPLNIVWVIYSNSNKDECIKYFEELIKKLKDSELAEIFDDSVKDLKNDLERLYEVIDEQELKIQELEKVCKILEDEKEKLIDKIKENISSDLLLKTIATMKLNNEELLLKYIKE